MRRARWMGSVLIIMVAAPFQMELHAQSTKVELSGLVSDPSGLAVGGADVRLVNVNTEAEQAMVTGDDGRYHFVALQPGTYTIIVTKTGF